MNFKLTQIPERTATPRQHGITMVMDKGLSIEEAKNFLSAASPHVDIIKLGFGTAFVTPNLRQYRAEKPRVLFAYPSPRVYARQNKSRSGIKSVVVVDAQPLICPCYF